MKCPCRWLDMPADAEGSCRNCGHGPERHDEAGCSARMTPQTPEARLSALLQRFNRDHPVRSEWEWADLMAVDLIAAGVTLDAARAATPAAPSKETWADILARPHEESDDEPGVTPAAPEALREALVAAYHEEPPWMDAPTSDEAFDVLAARIARRLAALSETSA